MTPQLHIPSILFGQQERTLFTVNGEPAVWFQDVRDRDDIGLVLRYTTINGEGMMSVYHESLGGVTVADSDRTILCDEHGNPTEVTGIQRYFPPSVLCPAYLEVGERKFYRTEGQWAWSSGDNYPAEPWPDATYAHENAFFSDGVRLWWDEDFYMLGKRVYSRGFLFDVADRTLLQFTDNLNGATYERA